jgi:predicted transcriptional regulator
MNLNEIQKVLAAEILTPDLNLNVEIKSITVSDLMSDVLTNSGHGDILITGLVNAQTIRTAEVVDLCGIVFARGKRPSSELIQMAEERKIPLLTTSLSIYHACGSVYMYEIQNRKT